MKLALIKDIEFDKDIIVILRGKEYKRHYEIQRCKYCNEIMYPKVKPNAFGVNPESSSDYKKRNYCNKAHASYSRGRKVIMPQFTVALTEAEAICDRFLYGKVI